MLTRDKHRFDTIPQFDGQAVIPCENKNNNKIRNWVHRRWKLQKLVQFGDVKIYYGFHTTRSGVKVGENAWERSQTRWRSQAWRSAFCCGNGHFQARKMVLPTGTQIVNLNLVNGLTINAGASCNIERATQILQEAKRFLPFTLP